MCLKFNFFSKKSTSHTNYCGNCDKDTKQKVFESGHERDSSNDSFHCLECG